MRSNGELNLRPEGNDHSRKDFRFAMQTSAKLLNCMFFGAVIASVYFLYAIFVRFEPWTSLAWAAAIAFTTKCLAVALQDYVKRHSVIPQRSVSESSTQSSRFGGDDRSKNATELRASKVFSTDVNNAIANLTAPDPISSTNGEGAWSQEAYQLGFALGRQWTSTDDKAKPTNGFENLGSGKEWLDRHGETLAKMTKGSDESPLDPENIPGDPSPSFLAGFIDGAQAP